MNLMFNSASFLLFLVLVLITYFQLPQKYRWILLLAASYLFYSTLNSWYLVFIVASTLVDYFAALKIGSSNSKVTKVSYLLVSLVANLGLLYFFKYHNFFIDSASSLFNWSLSGLHHNFLLPVGISFYTFQTLSYSIDVYRGRIKPEKHLGIFALYVSFFPQLVAGPIERAHKLLPQFRIKHSFSYQRFISALGLVLWGYFLKIVLADRVALVANQIFNNVSSYSGIPLLIGVIFFSFQIYGDFAGYSLIAIGVAKMMGFNLMTNFKRPYFSKNISDFWRRWHISLTTWFKDYVYIPLGGNRVKRVRLYVNIFIVFIVSGIWHGAAYTFIVWGFLHGLYFLVRDIFTRWLTKHARFKVFDTYLFSLLYTYAVVCVGWVFFRANTLSDAIYFISHLFASSSHSIFFMGGTANFTNVLLGFLMITITILVDFVLEIDNINFLNNLRQKLVRNYLKNVYFRNVLFSLLLLLIIYFGVYGGEEFIYFQF